MVRRLVWDQEIGGSNPPSPTAVSVAVACGYFCIAQSKNFIDAGLI
jgi:hypothetical protein